MLLPPVDPAVLSANAKFDALYNDLCNNKLNSNGTSKLDAKTQQERDTLREELHKSRIEAAKREIVKSGLQSLSYRPDYLPKDLQELVAIIAAVLEGQILEEDRDLLQDDFTKFKENIKPIITALSKLLQEDVDTIATTIDPDSLISAPVLPASANNLKESIATSRSNVAASRLSLAQEATTLHDLYRQAIHSSIRILEQTIHGSVARGTKAKADYLALVAEGMNKKLSVQHGQFMSQFYSSDVQKALHAKRDGLENESKVTKRRIREAGEKLAEYKKAGGMEKMAEDYAEILKESERVRAEIGRLQDGKE